MKCPYYQKCGACNYPLDDYQKSLSLKLEQASKTLKPFKVKRVVENPQIYHYRHKIIYRFFKVKGVVKAGLYAEGSGKLIDIDECLIEHPIGSKILSEVLKLANRYHMEVYNPINKTGLLRYLLLRVAKDGKVLLCLVVGNSDFKGSNNFVKQLRQKFPEIVGVDLMLNRRATNVVMEGQLKTIYGKGYLLDQLKDYRFLLSSDAFYQVNPDMAEIIYNDVVAALKPGADDIVLDAYCGIGTISLFLAAKAKNVIGVEVNPKAILNAKKNAELNQITNVHFKCQSVDDYILSDHFDLLVVDPPRSGMSEQFIKAVLKAKPKTIVYVSCDISTMVRDLQYLKKDYQIDDITLYDQFGFTKHFEAMTVCHKKSDKI